MKSKSLFLSLALTALSLGITSSAMGEPLPDKRSNYRFAEAHGFSIQEIKDSSICTVTTGRSYRAVHRLRSIYSEGATIECDKTPIPLKIGEIVDSIGGGLSRAEEIMVEVSREMAALGYVKIERSCHRESKTVRGGLPLNWVACTFEKPLN